MAGSSTLSVLNYLLIQIIVRSAVLTGKFVHRHTQTLISSCCCFVHTELFYCPILTIECTHMIFTDYFNRGGNSFKIVLKLF